MPHLKNIKLTLLIGFIVNIIMINPTHAETVRIAGSSTVFPFSTVIAEQIGRKTGSPPIVESTGSGSGMRSICKKDIDIANSSRRAKASEIVTCQQNGTNLIEFWVGRDGIVLAVNKDNTQLTSLSLKQLYQALAKQVHVKGQLVANPYKKWNEISPDLPNSKILIYGPPPTSGTRDALENLGLLKGAEAVSEMAILKKNDKKQFEKLAATLREDGVYVEGGENDNLLIRKLNDEKDAIAIFGFSYLDSNQGAIRGVSINNIAPDFDNIVENSYRLARPLYFYVRHDRWPDKNLQDYVRAFIHEDAIGADGFLLDKGLVPLSEEEFSVQHKQLSDAVRLTEAMLR